MKWPASTSTATSFPRSPLPNCQRPLTATWCFVLIATQAALRAGARAGRAFAKTEPGLTEKPELAQDYQIGSIVCPSLAPAYFAPHFGAFDFQSNLISAAHKS